MTSYFSLGLMSGSSLDGLDICYSRIDSDRDSYYYELIKATTIPYSPSIYESLSNCRELSSSELNLLHEALGDFFGRACLGFLSTKELSQLNFICSHGHTVYHFPEKGRTLQIGSAQQVANLTGVQTLTNLRAADIARGGSGAPIVPIGDFLFFSNYKYCLNLGGIMNISEQSFDTITSFDIGVCNQIINHYAQFANLSYDRDGLLARNGQFNESIFTKLNEQDYFKRSKPKSLDNAYSHHLISLIDSENVPFQDKLNSFYHHIAHQVSLASDDKNLILCTGGGCHNIFLIELMKRTYKLLITIPCSDLINYKEALIMSLIGVRFMENKFNVLASVTGAEVNTKNGELFLPFV